MDERLFQTGVSKQFSMSRREFQSEREMEAFCVFHEAIFLNSIFGDDPKLIGEQITLEGHDKGKDRPDLVVWYPAEKILAIVELKNIEAGPQELAQLNRYLTSCRDNPANMKTLLFALSQQTKAPDEDITLESLRGILGAPSFTDDVAASIRSSEDILGLEMRAYSTDQNATFLGTSWIFPKSLGSSGRERRKIESLNVFGDQGRAQKASTKNLSDAWARVQKTFGEQVGIRYTGSYAALYRKSDKKNLIALYAYASPPHIWWFPWEEFGRAKGDPYDGSDKAWEFLFIAIQEGLSNR